ncbi:hypothetical protein G6L16_000880 [Agrobacterium tumefaciens]|uniref:hypothetical protein n=1 Tax=Agrobacterium tumefaciens TaxID=358 RepID=UPI001572AEF0|nr:hypothetical protein [Agrobacterium tumefaciens]NSZ61884.1 hypothetical protein [Agrobacterium tumefaciens]NTA68256.1 hypothetical protein [Agrobacterium tumefaciens]WIE38096.1 hypothetical protein G6L16_000880 [Agrobacterium tumefaciens]
MAKNSILDYSTTPDNNTDIGGIGIQGTSAVNNFDNAFRTIMSQLADWTDGSTIASGTTTDLSTVKGMYVSVTGTSTITSFGTAKAGWIKYLRFTGAATITHNATSMILPAGASITTSAGDYALFVSEGSGNWRCLEYVRASGFSPLISGYISPEFNIANDTFNPTTTLSIPDGAVASSGLSPILMKVTAGLARIEGAYGDGGFWSRRFDSAVSDGWWHIFIISNGATVDWGLSKSLNPTSQPNYPAGYAHYRRVASWPRVGGALLAVTQREDDFMRASEVQDRNSLAGFGPGLFSVSTPLGIVTQPKIRSIQSMATAGNIQTSLGSANKVGGSEVTVVTTAAGEADGLSIMSGIFTDTNSQIQLAVTAPGGGTLAINIIFNEGWIDKRGRA